MTIDDTLNGRRPDIEPELVDQGIAQLTIEIRILKNWLDNLDNDELAQRKSYEDMLRSRREMLLFLQDQKIRQESPEAGDKRD